MPGYSGSPFLDYTAQAAGNFGGQLIAGIQNKKAQKRAMEYNKEMWHMQNAYNAPIAQMQRLREAGLNPRLIYGQQSGMASGKATERPKAIAESYGAASLPGMGMIINQFQDLRVKQAKTNQLREMARTAKIENTTKMLRDLAKLDNLQQQYRNRKQDWKAKELENTRRKIKIGIEKVLAGIEQPKDTMAPFYQQKLAEIARTQADARKTTSQADLIDIERDFWRDIGKSPGEMKTIMMFLRMVLGR